MPGAGLARPIILLALHSEECGQVLDEALAIV
jgi:hypothetical protein